MTISAQDVHRLLTAEPGAVLVVLEGRADVVSPADLQSDRYRGALEVTTRDELMARVGGAQLSDREVAELAADLDIAVAEMGG